MSDDHQLLLVRDLHARLARKLYVYYAIWGRKWADDLFNGIYINIKQFIIGLGCVQVMIVVFGIRRRIRGALS